MSAGADPVIVEGMTDHTRPNLPESDRDELRARRIERAKEEANDDTPAPAQLLDDITHATTTPTVSIVLDVDEPGVANVPPSDEPANDGQTSAQALSEDELRQIRDIAHEDMWQDHPILTAIANPGEAIERGLEAASDFAQKSVDYVGEVIESGMGSAWSGEESSGDGNDGSDDDGDNGDDDNGNDDGDDNGSGGGTISGGASGGGSMSGQHDSAPADLIDPGVDVDLGSGSPDTFERLDDLSGAGFDDALDDFGDM